jgi:hypothetical protein
MSKQLAKMQLPIGKKTYTVTVIRPDPDMTYASDRQGRQINPVEDAVCLVDVDDGQGFVRTARLSLPGVTAAALNSVGAADEDAIVSYYLDQLPMLMDVPPDRTKSWPGILNTPEGQWFNHQFEHNTAYDAIKAKSDAKKTKRKT